MADLVFRTKPWIDGRATDATTEDTFESFNPATGEVLVTLPACSEKDIDVAVASARAVFVAGTWSQSSPADRKAVLLKFADLVEANADELARLDSLDAGKPLTDCREIDLPDAVNTLRWYAEAADKVFGKISPTSGENLALITREASGVVAAVVPWNFPLCTLAWKIAPALAAGNSVVVKPAEQSTLSTLRIAELASEAGLPDGVLNVVPGLGHVAGKALGLHPDVDVVTFTGSTEVGRHFLRYSADSNLKRVVLECGGKSPQIVLEGNEDRLEAIAEELAGAAFWNMGENCTAGSRILVHVSLVEEFTAALVAQAATWTVGDPGDADTKIGALIEEAHLAKVLGYLERGRAEGATVAFGGRQVRTETGGWFVEPTVFTGVTPDMAIAREEIFGPVVCVVPFADEEEAVRLANDSQYGLAASLFTHDLDVAHRMARRIKAGTVAVNCYGEGDISTPFGGMRTSGFGGYDKGIEAFDQYTDLKTTWFKLG